MSLATALGICSKLDVIHSIITPMFSVRRWWEKSCSKVLRRETAEPAWTSSKVFLVSLALLTAWSIRHTKAAIVSEIYGAIANSFDWQQQQAQKQQILTDARTEELRQRVNELQQQQQQLMQLLHYIENQSQPPITSPVIGRSPDSWWQQFIIGRGSNDGIKPGDVVSGVGGLVGRVVQVTPRTSRVMLISDSRSRVGIQISRSRSPGFVQGQNSQMATVQFFEKVPDVRVGDTVTTSAVSRLFPAGIPIGTVKTINLEKGPAPEAIIELNAPLNILEWVVIHSFEVK